VLRIHHPDGTAESFTYNALGQVLTHTDGKGQTTRLQRTSRGLPSRRQDVAPEPFFVQGTSNKQNPVGVNNPNRERYLAAADNHSASSGRPKSSGTLKGAATF